MERIERESFRLFCPDLADVFVGREAFERLEPAYDGGDGIRAQSVRLTRNLAKHEG